MNQFENNEPYATLAAYVLESITMFQGKDPEHGSCRLGKLTTALNQTKLSALICRPSLVTNH
uniref:Uncharacterized protein n=1 Tax=Arundo donax TaxID=35708 RepID=A0A0A8YY34_ARUDO